MPVFVSTESSNGLPDDFDPLPLDPGGAVEQYEEDTGAGTGFLFDDLTPRSVYDVTGWAVWAWYNRPGHINSMRRRAMKKRFSWKKAALRYREVYSTAKGRK